MYVNEKPDKRPNSKNYFTKEDNQKIFFDGQIFDAFCIFADIIGHAKKEIVLIDG